MSISIGLQVFSVRKELAKDFWGTLEKVAVIGYENIEFANHAADKDPGVGFNIAADVLKKRMDELGLKTVAAHVHPMSVDIMENVIDYHQAIGNKSIVCGIGFWKNRDEVLEFSKYLNKIGEICRKRDMDFYYHNHFMEFQKFDGQYVMDTILEHTEKELVKIELDTYWAIRGGINPIEYLRKLGDRCDLVHQKDLTPEAVPANIFETIGEDCEIGPAKMREFSKVEYFTEVGEGTIDIKSIITEMKSIGAAKYLILEQDHSARNELESIAISYKNLKRLLSDN
ncbi:sugar phosphate isomerase/epimerase family protein [Paenibacillus cremeus]|uniref:Sugar phosphate isomerase/epimerase n=1 Tax=Paenibacillus cremeus TaxID=2163881 RepID=A0A559K8C0_9BACL|nr:sugar phosphate isomerase/epimerase [Paenibacillus cremeus]TVY08333.1 sugar phosphate isomerase/epimerase [Paenibacillus cremeus]